MGKFDLSADELKKFDLTPDESAPKSKYPGPKNLTDDQAGLSTSPIKSVRLPGTALSTPLRQDMSQLEFDARAKGYADDASRVENALGDATLGKLLGSVSSGAPAAKTAKGINAGSQFAKAGEEGGFIRDVLNHWSSKVLGEKAAVEAAKKLGYTGPQIARVMSETGKAALPGAAVAGGAVARAKPEDEPKPYKGVMSNAIERLRASAPGNPRAQELLNRIDQIPADNGAGTSEVTQGTLGE